MTISVWRTDNRDAEIGRLVSLVEEQRKTIAHLSDDKIMLERQLRRLRGYMASLASGSFV